MVDDVMHLVFYTTHQKGILTKNFDRVATTLICGVIIGDSQMQGCERTPTLRHSTAISQVLLGLRYKEYYGDYYTRPTLQLLH